MAGFAAKGIIITIYSNSNTIYLVQQHIALVHCICIKVTLFRNNQFRGKKLHKMKKKLHIGSRTNCEALYQIISSSTVFIFLESNGSIYMHRVLADSNIFSILESYFKSKQKSTHSLEMQISELDFELKNQKGSRS